MAEPPPFDIFSLDLVVPAAAPAVLPVEVVEDLEMIPEPKKEEESIPAPNSGPNPESRHEPEPDEEPDQLREEPQDNIQGEGVVPVNEAREGEDEDDDDEANPEPEPEPVESASDSEPATPTVFIYDTIETRLSHSRSAYRGTLHKILECIVCPISHDLPKTPVIGSDGNTYDAEFIKSWLLKHETSPITREKIRCPRTQNRAVANIIDILKNVDMNWIDGPTALRPSVYRRMRLLRADHYLRLRERANGKSVHISTARGGYDLEMDTRSSTLDDLVLAFGHVADLPPDVEIEFGLNGRTVTEGSWALDNTAEVFELVENEFAHVQG